VFQLLGHFLEEIEFFIGKRVHVHFEPVDEGDELLEGVGLGFEREVVELVGRQLLELALYAVVELLLCDLQRARPVGLAGVQWHNVLYFVLLQFLGFYHRVHVLLALFILRRIFYVFLIWIFLFGILFFYHCFIFKFVLFVISFTT